MLGIIQGQLAHVEPGYDLPGPFKLDVSKPDEKGRGRVQVTAGNQPVVAGVTYYLMGDKTADVNPFTGEFQVKKGKSAVIRAVFAGQHLETTVRASTFRGPIRPMGGAA